MIASLALLATVSLASAPTETPAQTAARMKWWKEARFGMFIHWGLYSIPAGKWGNETGHGEWIRDTAKIPVGEYEKFKGKFNPVRFNADTWAKIAKDAGMKYVVITTKHHDGFNLFPSKYTDWSIASTPFKRDIMRELSTAVRKNGLKMGWYHSIMDWHHPDYLPRRSWEVKDRPAAGADFDRFVKYLHNDVKQLLTDYGPISVLWFDGEWESTWTPQYGKKLYDMVRATQPSIIVNNRVSPGRSGMEDSSLKAGDYGTPEQYIPETGLGDTYWETCMTMNDHWGYNAKDENWKSAFQLVLNLVDIASKGGNYLLNVGPRADGTIPPESIERLHEIGEWMDKNGEAIYGTTASVFEHVPLGRSTTKRHGKGTTLYFHLLEEPMDGKLVVPSLANVPLSARILGGKKLSVQRANGGLIIPLPHRDEEEDEEHEGRKEKEDEKMPRVVAVEIAGAPVVYRRPQIVSPSDLVLNATTVTLKARNPGDQLRYTLDDTNPTAKSPLYREPFVVRGGTTVKVAAFSGARQRTEPAIRSFVQAELHPATELLSSTPGFWRETFLGSWEALPNFDSLTAKSREVVSTPSVPMNGTIPAEQIGLRFSGYLDVPRDGIYEFALTSDDGGQLRIDDQLVANGDGLHSAQRFVGRIALAKGFHPIDLRWFNGTGGAALKLEWGRVGGPLRLISADDLHRGG